MRLTLISILVALLLPTAAAAAPPGERTERAYPGGYRAIQYTPAALDRSRPAPLFVMVHGCNTTAEEQEAANELNEQAERDGFVVLYPDHDRRTALHAIGCWNFETDTSRASPDPAAIAAMVTDAIGRASPRIDPDRVYLSGMSSGAMMAGIVGTTHPELFAAIHMNAGCAYRAVTCAFMPPSRDTEELAREARATMGERRRVVPVLVTHGDQDGTVPPSHAPQVVEQWRMTNNLTASGGTAGPIAAAPTRTREDAPAGRRTSLVEQYDVRGCTILERWTIRGMDHFWPGGSTDPASAPFTDPTGPDGGDLAWAFFKRYERQAGSASPCVAARTPIAAPAPAPASARRACTSRRVLTVTVPRRLRAARATFAGRRLRVQGRRVRIDLRGKARGTYRLTVTGRTPSGRLARITRSYRTCA